MKSALMRNFVRTMRPLLSDNVQRGSVTSRNSSVFHSDRIHRSSHLQTLVLDLGPRLGCAHMCTTVAKESTKSEAPPPPEGGGEVSQSEHALVLEQLEETKKRATDFQDKYMRALAENQNTITRMKKQVEDSKVYGIQGLVKDLLEFSDVLHSALEAVPKEEVSESNIHLKNLHTGLTMVSSSLHQVFKKHGVQVIDPLGEKFNPNYHEALFQQEVEGKTSGTIVTVSKVGYKLSERVVRPALVGVAK